VPFPLAHPVAVLPLRRFCPAWLSFAGLMVGSITPDLGYSFRGQDFQDFTHSFLGTLVFCLPAGFIALQIILFIRAPLASTLPSPHREALLPLCRTPHGSWWRQALSVLIGAWTHSLFDAFTHESALRARRSEVLQGTISSVESTGLKFYQLLWIIVSLGGLMVLLIVYRRYLRRATGTTRLWDPADGHRIMLWLGILLVPYLVIVPIAFFPDWRGFQLNKHTLYASLQPYLILLTGIVTFLGVALRLRGGKSGGIVSSPGSTSSSDTPAPSG
jgi:hypothetical protein